MENAKIGPKTTSTTEKMPDATPAGGIDLPNLPMTLYKYRTLEPFEYVADIIHNNRFHTARFDELNDPMEGLFDADPRIGANYLKRIEQTTKQTRICSFSRTPRCPVLWAHYADGFRGVCIEIEISECPPGHCAASRTGIQIEVGGVLFVSLDYSGTRSVIYSKPHADLACRAPHVFLMWKAEDWKLEEEVRAFSRDEFIRCGNGIRITRVLLGLRTPEVVQTAIRRMTPADVSVWTTRIGGSNEIEIDGEIPADGQ